MRSVIHPHATITNPPAKHAAGPKCVWTPGAAVPAGRITLYDLPKDGQRYSLGLDFALGIPGKDLDAGIMLDGDGHQVLTLHGHWGETFPQVITPVLEHFGWHNVFVVGEASQSGIPILRGLYDKGAWIYFHRKTETRGRTPRDMLGHVPTQMDVTVQWLRGALHPETCRLKLRDAELLTQIRRFGFRPKSTTVEPDEARDAQLQWGAPPGEHDDLVRAAALANAGLRWLPKFEPPKPKLPPNSIGKLLGFDKDEEPPKRYWE